MQLHCMLHCSLSNPLYILYSNVWICVWKDVICGYLPDVDRKTIAILDCLQLKNVLLKSHRLIVIAAIYECAMYDCTFFIFHLEFLKWSIYRRCFRTYLQMTLTN